MLHIGLTIAAIVLNEVLYDPEGPDSGREFVELLNVSDSPVALAGLVIEAGDGARPGTWRVAWTGAAGELAPGDLLVIAGDSLEARERLRVDLQNGPDAVRLRRGTEVLDRLGYGELTAVELFEGRPAPDVSGRSLARWPDGTDTDDNAADFVGATPSPGRRNRPRRDLGLALTPPDPTRSWPGRWLTARVVVRNAGLDPAGSEWHVRASLQPEPLDSLTAHDVPLVLPQPIAPGDSVEGTCGWVGGPGLFRLAVRLDPTDEVPDNDAAWVRVRVGAGPVVVNEIQFAPEVGETEWVELWNRDTQVHDLTGWTLEDASGRPGTLRPPAFLAAGAYGIASPDTTSPIGGLAPGTWRASLTPWNALNNSDGDDGFADQLILRDAQGVVQDALFYMAGWSRERGRSLERLTAEPDVRGLLWAASKDPGRSTPGRVNSATAPPARGARVELQPNPFSPDGDGHEETLGAAIEVPEGYDGFRARIFDLDGRCRANLAADRLGPGPRRLAWDGRNDGGLTLPRGVYVLDIEFHSKSLAGFHERRTIGLVRR